MFKRNIKVEENTKFDSTQKFKPKKPFYKRWWFIAIIVIGIIGAFGSSDEEKSKDNAQVNNSSSNEATVDLNVTGNMSFVIENDKVVVEITSNAVDGSLFETSVMDSEFNLVSDFIEIKNGVGVKEFDLNENWDVGYLSGIAMLRFNLDNHPQPDHVKEMYGEYGEKIEGNLAVENNLGGKNVNIEGGVIAYPDEETVKKKQKEVFSQAIKELISISDGVLLKIQPHFKDDDWSSVAVMVNDSWYYSAEHEKERFAENISETIQTIIHNSGIVSRDKLVTVYFYDAYKKELATPKVLGGYKIIR